MTARKGMGDEAARLLARVRERRPVVQCITNAVTANDCANLLLAVGASPTMAHHPLEAAEIASSASALVCNFGAIADYEAMEKAGRCAQELGHAIVVDPVGVAASSYRRLRCLAFLEQIRPTCIRGNRSEIEALMDNRKTAAGVDSAPREFSKEEQDDFLSRMRVFAQKTRTILIASGAADLITDGRESLRCENGHPLMTCITGSGCMSSALLGAFLSVSPSVEGAAVCCAFMGIAGELAAAGGGGTMSFRNRLIDAASLLTPEDFIGKERIFYGASDAYGK